MWYFGQNAGLDFNTTPPAILNNGQVNTQEGCAAISDASGSLLFYTDGEKIWNKTHAVMANGNGLFGNSSSTQSAIILKKPGSSDLYYVFTVEAGGGGDLNYSIVDMTLASGNGSVTVKNATLSANMTEKLIWVKHCNGKDFWIIAHRYGSNSFCCFLLTGAGVSTAPVLSAIGSIHGGTRFAGNLKAAPSHKKLGLAIYDAIIGSFELFDFDNITGVVSNSLSLGSAFPSPYGCEFSPDGSKFYGCYAASSTASTSTSIYQWNLCAGTPSAIVASQFTLFAASPVSGMQTGPDGKIYVSKYGPTSLGVINNPNNAGIACNYVHNGQSIAPNKGTWNLPNFSPGGFNTQLPTFGTTLTKAPGCKVLDFTAPPTLFTGTSCAVPSTVNGMKWDFGDPSTGLNNTSTLSNPTHTFSNYGSYTVQLVVYFDCRSDTVKKTVTIQQLLPQISTNGAKCTNDTLLLSGSGGNAYYWQGPGGFNSTLQNAVVLHPAGGVYTLQVSAGQCSASATSAVTLYPVPILALSPTVSACEGKQLELQANASGSTLTYTWTGPNNYKNYTAVAFLSGSAKASYAGTYSLTVKDINGCKTSTAISVAVLQNPAVSATSATVCLNSPAMLIATGGASYYWTGPGFLSSAQDTLRIQSASSVLPLTYTVVGAAANSCTNISFAQLATVPLPEAHIAASPKTEVCLKESIYLEGSGGVYYRWKSPSGQVQAGKTFTVTSTRIPIRDSYTLIVTNEQGCENFATIPLVVRELPEGSLAGKMQGCVPFSSDYSFYSATPADHISSSWQLDGKNFPGKSFSYPFNTAGNYPVTGFFRDELSSCTNTVTFVIQVHPLPKADFSYLPEKPVEAGEEVVFTNTSEGKEQKKWSWHFINDEGFHSENENTSYFFKDAGVYPVAFVVTNTWSCSDTVVKAVTVAPDFLVYVPNAFTPNGDGLNEVFIPVMRGVKLYELSVFNRWGQQLFHTKDLQSGWDGTFKGTLCKSDTYVWKMNISSLAGEMKEMSGFVLLEK